MNLSEIKVAEGAEIVKSNHKISPKPEITTEDIFVLEIVEGVKDLVNRGKIKKSKLHLYKNRIKEELRVISKNGFIDYFLIIKQICDYAREEGIVMGYGRGSVGGSVIAYLLKIHKCDPIEHELYFERFLNSERISPPDIDLDFSSKDRDKIFQFVKNIYGSYNVARIGTLQEYCIKNSIKDLCKAYGIGYDEINQVIRDKEYPSIDRAVEDIALQNVMAPIPDWESTIRFLSKLSRQPSVHACGAVVSATPLEKFPLGNYEGESLINLTMEDVERLGLLKIDLLGIKNLDIVSDTIDLVKETQGFEVDLENMTFDDPNVFNTISRGNTAGIFQMSGRGMTEAVKKIRPKNIGELSDVLALYRPGAMEFIDRYISNKNALESGAEESVVPLHKRFKGLLDDTHQILIYQEQTMNIFRKLANFTLAEADIIRKGIGKKKAEILEYGHKRLIEELGEEGEEIWEFIKQSGNYSFNKSHSVAYAHLTYLTAYLKTYFYTEFYAVLFNYTSFAEDRENYMREACKNGVSITHPTVSRPSTKFVVGGHKVIYGGIASVDGISQDSANKIMNYFESHNTIDIESFIRYSLISGITKRQILPLIKINFFEGIPFSEEYKKLVSCQFLEKNIDLLLRYYRAQNTGKPKKLVGAGPFVEIEGGIPEINQIQPTERLLREYETCKYIYPETLRDVCVAIYENNKAIVNDNKFYVSNSSTGSEVYFIGYIEKVPDKKIYRLKNHKHSVSAYVGYRDAGKISQSAKLTFGIFKGLLKDRGFVANLKVVYRAFEIKK